MAKFFFSELVFVYAIVCLRRTSLAELAADLPKCCQNGINWGKEELKCGNYQRPVSPCADGCARARLIHFTIRS